MTIPRQMYERVRSVRFEPGTIAADLKRMDVVHQSADAPILLCDESGVLVGDDFFPWHRVQSVKLEKVQPVDRVSLRAPHDIAELRDLPGKIVAVESETKAAKPPKRK